MPVLECGYDTLVFAEALCRAGREATWENAVVFQSGLQPRVLVFATFMTIHLFCGIL